MTETEKTIVKIAVWLIKFLGRNCENFYSYELEQAIEGLFNNDRERD